MVAIPVSLPHVHLDNKILRVHFTIATYSMCWNIIPSNTSAQHYNANTAIISLIKNALHTEDFYNHDMHKHISMSCIKQSDYIDVLSCSITASVWIAVLEFVCQCIVAPHLNVDNEHRICATVCHIKP